MRVWFTLIPFCISEGIKGNTQGHKSSNWMQKVRKVVVTNRKRYNKHVVGETTYQLKNIRYFRDASFPLKRNIIDMIHLCSTVFISETGFVFPLQLVSDTSFNLQLQMLCYLQQSQTSLEMFYYIFWYVRSRLRNNQTQAHLWQRKCHLRITWGD